MFVSCVKSLIFLMYMAKFWPDGGATEKKIKGVFKSIEFVGTMKIHSKCLVIIFST